MDIQTLLIELNKKDIKFQVQLVSFFEGGGCIGSQI